MQKNKQNLRGKLITLLFSFLTLSLLWTKTADASSVSITQLPGYINFTDFKIACSALGGTTAQFSAKKDGGSYTDFGSVIDLTNSSCQTQVTGLQFGSEGKFFFKVTLNDGSFAETSTTLDTTATGNVSDFGKERTNSGTTYKIHWKNPLESDFVKVFIYRGTEAGFAADDSHKVAEIGGNPGDTQNWDDNGLEATKEYYYAIRALDHANNSSGLVGDSGTTTTTSSTSSSGSVLGSSTATPSKVTQLPLEGDVLGEEANPSSSPEAASTILGEETPIKSGLFNWIATHKKISLGLLALLGAIYYRFFFSKKK